MKSGTVKVTFLPEGKTSEVRPGTTLLEAARRAGIVLRTRCGGKAGCLMCKVHAADVSSLEKPAHNELLKLGAAVNEGVRLACQAKVARDTEVHVPEDPLRAAIRKQLEQQKEDDSLW
ncbi:2Fe-2S iron-sulfur cluster-binding protein [Paenibacillus turpanensis]|uniref:2Fe-2S iron-sulfur cluster-binding protein n=1 Tax=Paenibacillus turpanensis TaxID=2689078 RepID=UPI001407D9D3|nr:2Fe-2S iron-sulfur cluster-binding protein [Paenibacillus turpanensis]